MATFEELARSSRRESWREMRGYRADPLAKGVLFSGEQWEHRRKTFTAALEQAEQLLLAAETVNTAARPLLMFYGLAQAGRAIAAVSSALPATKTGQQDWKFSAHGLRADVLVGRRGLSTATIREELTKPEGRSAFHTVARALRSPVTLPPSGLCLGLLWPTIPETRSVPLPGQSAHLALLLTGADQPTQSLHYTGNLECVPANLFSESDPASVQRARLTDDLRSYPSLGSWSLSPRGERPLRAWLEKYWTIELIWDSNDFPQVTPSSVVTVPYHGSRYVLPSFAEGAQSWHPLLVWWCVLFTLSIAARYEPELWAKFTDIDSSADANPIEHLLEQGLDAVPELVVSALRDLR